MTYDKRTADSQISIDLYDLLSSTEVDAHLKVVNFLECVSSTQKGKEQDKTYDDLTAHNLQYDLKKGGIAIAKKIADTHKEKLRILIQLSKLDSGLRRLKNPVQEVQERIQDKKQELEDQLTALDGIISKCIPLRKEYSEKNYEIFNGAIHCDGQLLEKRNDNELLLQKALIELNRWTEIREVELQDERKARKLEAAELEAAELEAAELEARKLEAAEAAELEAAELEARKLEARKLEARELEARKLEAAKKKKKKKRRVRTISRY